MKVRARLSLAPGGAVALPWQVHADVPAPLRFIAPMNHTMPFADFEHAEITGGIVKDSSEAVARRAQRQLRTHPRGLALSVAGRLTMAVHIDFQHWVKP